MIVLTNHAVSRYIERVKPGLNPEAARRECEALRAMGYRVRGLIPQSDRRYRNRERARRTFARTHKRRPEGRPMVEAA